MVGLPLRRGGLALVLSLLGSACTVATGFDEYGFEEPSREAPMVELSLLGCTPESFDCQCESTARGGTICAYEWEIFEGPPAYKLPVFFDRVRLEATAACETCVLDRVTFLRDDEVLREAEARDDSYESFTHEMGLSGTSLGDRRIVVHARATSVAGRTGGDAQTLIFRRIAGSG